ncbi:RagB/SusD family nutrient uptake outer membrane protein [Polaribacter aestuariivivens]|uniref:RagB/SusD family nutrient uptake outer membrane protein n=1 Tax=Polaribacter aestuariivivens TaxID=2304626 RepID=A0A5S3NCR8_9FLAO|nr:RagB/SusD family nutrient uptake outer membrane protein [Polaribacter aestuariivivens]TMM31519.1 RagB/SusD family nutrient uptake outer membrane protein [Polaribacter aestuariivivens]
MKKIFKIEKIATLFLVIVMAMSSCTKDLDITPKDDQDLLGEDFFTKETAYKELLGGVYGNLSLTGVDGPGSSFIDGLDAGTSQFGRVLLYLQTLSADQMIWSYENDPGTREIQRNIWNANDPIILGMFGRSHVTIAFANNFLRETTDAKLAERNVSDAIKAEITTYRAEARLLRAMSYYYMMDLFGQANFTTEEDPINTPPKAYDRAQLFDFIESELKAIEADLPDPLLNEHGRASKGVSWMILAKIYLNAEVYIGQDKYTECIDYCKKIIAGGYTLATQYSHNFMADNDVNSAKNEIIFPLISDGTFTQNFGPTTVMVNGSVGSLEVNGAALGVGAGGWGGALRLRKQFVELFEASIYNNDTRNGIISGGRSKEITDISNKDQGYILEKFSNAKSTGGFGVDQTFVDTDFPLFRLADVYLMYAEAHLRGGAGATVANVEGYINALRTRANNPQNNLTISDINLSFIIDERARELHWEAHRRQDLIRFGRFTGGNYNWAWKGNGTNGIALSADLKLYPIPSASLKSNPELKQNPGY